MCLPSREVAALAASLLSNVIMPQPLLVLAAAQRLKRFTFTTVPNWLNSWCSSSVVILGGQRAKNTPVLASGAPLGLASGILLGLGIRLSSCTVRNAPEGVTSRLKIDSSACLILRKRKTPITRRWWHGHRSNSSHSNYVSSNPGDYLPSRS